VLPYTGLYAQAVSLYRSGFRYWFTDTEVHELNNYNKSSEEPISEEKLFCQYFRTPNKGKKGSFMSVAEIRKRIGTILKYNLSKSKINRAMDKLGYVRTHNDKLRGFLVIAFTPDELANRKQVTAINSPQKQPLLPF
ncbi:MAG: hypothetical protein RR371_05955, partial [Bacteroides sp.]